jgi:hypothetical protein
VYVAITNRLPGLGVFRILNRLLDFCGFVVKKICEAGLGPVSGVSAFFCEDAGFAGFILTMPGHVRPCGVALYDMVLYGMAADSFWRTGAFRGCPPQRGERGTMYRA